MNAEPGISCVNDEPPKKSRKRSRAEEPQIQEPSISDISNTVIIEEVSFYKFYIITTGCVALCRWRTWQSFTRSWYVLL